MNLELLWAFGANEVELGKVWLIWSEERVSYFWWCW